MHSTDSDPVERIMAACFERPEAEWPAAFDEACREHPEHAEVIRRRLLKVQLMDAARPVGLELDQDFPEQLGDFDLLERLGGGGMGVVYRARQRSLGREVALKLIRPEHLFFSGARDRFRREVEAVAQLQHPGIVAIYTVDEEEGLPFFAMELLEGRTLAEVLHAFEGRAPESLSGADLHRCLTGLGPDESPAANFRGSWADACLNVAAQIAHALQHAHERDILHRDVKPSNVVLLPDGRAILLDFGLTSSAEASDKLTRTGSQVGTLVYMSPEQVEARTFDGRTDVYSLGVTLYELLTLQVPFRGEGVAQTQKRIVEGGADSIRARNRRVSQDAEVVCLTAMSARVGDRYADAKGFARDLENVLARRPIEAKPPGTLRRFLRWTERNPAKAVAAALGILLVVGLPTGLLVQESLYAREIDREHTNVLRLSAFHRLADHIALADTLWPPTPERIGAYEDWLARANEFQAELDFAVSQRDALREGALPVDPEDQALSHPRWAELEALCAKRRALQQQEAVRTGTAEPEEFELEDPPEEVERLHRRAWILVEPDRRVHGRESEALALSRLAFELAESEQDFHAAAWTLAWCLHSVGLDDEAREAAAMATDAGGAGSTKNFAALEEHIRAAEAGGLRQQLVALEAPIAALEFEVAERRQWTFELDEDRWWHDRLEKLIGELRPFLDDDIGLIRGVSPEHHWGVERRLSLARRLEELTLSGPKAQAAWEAAITSIQDVEQCPRYDGLEIVPQLGLLPRERNDTTGLWEFLHVMSGSPPVRDEHGKITQSDVGIVLVLLPGGEFWMGSQDRHAEGPNYDSDTTPAEDPPHPVRLDPFFLSKYELTQHQWQAFTGANPSDYTDDKSYWLGAHASDLHPVEVVSWLECAAFLERMGLDLPTEAQWEYAARAGTETIWWTGDDPRTLEGTINVADASALAVGGRLWPDYVEWLDDGAPVHAAIDTHRANPFGIFQMNGNVSEWCRDAYEGYAYPIVSGDGLRGIPLNGTRVVRGGAYPNNLYTTRSASRQGWDETTAHNWVGVRPARRLVLTRE